MANYVALLRGIGPGNPNMRNEKLREVFEDLGFLNVRTVISSGNVLFETRAKDIEELETKIEKALQAQLGFFSTTIIRTQEQLEKLIEANPFGDLEHSGKSYLMATFFKNSTSVDFKFPYQPAGKPYKFMAADDYTLFSVTNNSVITTSDLMTWLEKQFGKQITSRTWLTVNRLYKKLKEL